MSFTRPLRSIEVKALQIASGKNTTRTITARTANRRRLVLVPLLSLIIAFAQTPCASQASSADAALTPSAREAAMLLGILPKVERLIQLRELNSEHGAPGDEELALKVDVLDKVMGASLEVRMVSDRIDRELAWAFAGQNMLQARRQRILNYLFTANFMQGGILGVLSGPAFLHDMPIAGTDLLLIASSVGLGLSTLSLLASRSGTKKIDGGTTILADVFHLRQPEPEHRADMVQRFLNSVPPQSSSNKTRLEILIDRWKKGHYLRSTKERQLKKLSALEGSVDKQRENIRLISDRIRMLFDTQYTVQELDTGLLELLRATDIN